MISMHHNYRKTIPSLNHLKPPLFCIQNSPTPLMDSTKNLSEIIYPELFTTQKLCLHSTSTNNFMLWKLKLSFVLKDNHVHHILETPNPNSEDPSWTNAEQMTKSLIFQRLDPLLYHDFSNSPSVKSFLDDLEKTQKGIFSQYYLCEKYSRFRMDPDGDVNEHMFRMRAMAKLIGFAGVEIDENMQALRLLDSLPQSWDDDVEKVMMELHASKECLSFENVGRRLRAASEFREWRKYRDSGVEGGRRKVKGKSSTSNGDETCSLSDPWSLTELIYSQLKTRFQLNYSGLRFVYWKDQIHGVLMDNKVNYLLEDYSPSEEDANSQAHAKRLSDEFIARHLILGGMSDDLFLTFHDYPTARAMMDALETWFNSPSIARHMVLFRKYTGCQKSENAPIDEHLLDMDLMVCNLKAVGVEVADVMQAQRLINSLPRSWSYTQMTLRTNLEVTNDGNKKLKLVDRVRERVQSAGIFREMEKKTEFRI